MWFCHRSLVTSSARLLTANCFNCRGVKGAMAFATKAVELKDYNRFLNEVTIKRKPSLIRELTKMLATAEPGTIFMAGGLPNPSLFPFNDLHYSIENPYPSPSGGNNPPSSIFQSLSGPELRSALQYQPTQGYPPLYQHLKDFVTRYFPPPPVTSPTTDLIVTVGSQNALSVILEMCLKRGDPICVPGPIYSSALSIVKKMDPHSPKYLTVPEDDQGMVPAVLRSQLETWHKENPSNPPKLLYVNPTGANPSGVVMPGSRKQEIYKIACQFDLLIVEDDPYYFLHFLGEEPQTFLGMDVEGRVLRLDSFSKILSSGVRVGFCTGPQPLIRTMELCLQASILHAASLSQVMVHGVLKQWGPTGFKEHIDKVKAFYKKRRDLMITAADKHLKGLATYKAPQGGMFLWIKLEGVSDSFDMVMERGLQRKIMALPGREFMTDRARPCPFVRLSFSVVPEDQIEPGIIRLAELIKEEQALEKKA